jgi:predicted nuclease of predicted toxin-antitoxin system
VRILLDECLPRRLKRDLIGHEAKSVPEMGWAGKTNGALLTVAQTDFDVFLTVDRNLSFQQDINRFNIAVVVLVATSNKHAALQPLVPEVLSVLAALAPGQVVRVGA